MYYYRAFELNIASEIPLALLREREAPDTVDVTVVRGSAEYLDSLLAAHAEEVHRYEGEGKGFWHLRVENITAYNVSDAVSFIMENGNRISVVCANGDMKDGLLAVYLLGGCMSAILHMRGKLLIHGSCVVRDERALVIMGRSGAGKSTLAREFLQHGWKLITDDVTVISFEDGRAFAVPSYPSQKLWEDAIDNFGIGDDRLTPLWQENRAEKFHVSVEDSFSDAPAKLCYAVWLIKGPADCEMAVGVSNGFSKVDRLMRNIYRFYQVREADKPVTFQKCVDLGSQITMFEVVRPDGKPCADDIYNKLIAGMEESEKA